MLSAVDAQISTSELHAVEEPQHGTLEFPGPDVAYYTPSPGHTGPNRFSFAGCRPTTKGTTVGVRLNVRVSVVKP